MRIGGFLRGVVLGAVWIPALGCSLFSASTRPEPGAQRNLFCDLEYRPDPGFDGPDILFLAAAMPYKVEQVYMNPLEDFVHLVFAPGRHLSQPIAVEGAVCRQPWQAGHTLPAAFTRRHYLLCKRTDGREVRLTVRTPFGVCTQTLAADDLRPVCRPRFRRPNLGLRSMSPSVCADGSGE